VADVDDKGALATVEACHDIRPNSAVAVHCDVTNRDHLKEAISSGKAHFGKELDIMVNNAGIAVNDGEMSSPGKWKKMVQINLVAVIEGTHLAIEAMESKQSPGGVIINISSMAGIFPQPLTPVYSAVKSGVAMFTRSLKQLEHTSNIRVVALAPNFVETPIIQDIRDVRNSRNNASTALVHFQGLHRPSVSL
jgi:NAD(P)-dependent dehydrogenase (short-subunit alcohol dehydrogenase family)